MCVHDSFILIEEVYRKNKKNLSLRTKLNLA